ncbi:uncharacterized protein LOC110108791 [Dendrobium catenatum]|uniref:uncharacterized protein LOC110108791 n=1 Tax=Dendrobium catenatum TaxID=906689 RepID=UPI0009F5D405|nr:uncharacterized protein LOC110108791 [Dendrobium catenatum]
MDTLDPTLFPPMAQASTSVSASNPRVLDHLWSNIISEPAPSTPHIPVSLMETPEDIIPFNKDFTEHAAVEWSLCLVGYSIGKRPYYEALKETAKRIWKLKGTFQLIALTDGFFLFKFSLLEDYDMVWGKGAWFFHGKPFIFQKWTKNFNPTRENFSSVSIWVKIHNLPLVCWNSEGISKRASKIGILIVVDALTAAKTRLTYARICIQVSITSSFPESVAVTIEGDVIKLQNASNHIRGHSNSCNPRNVPLHRSKSVTFKGENQPDSSKLDSHVASASNLALVPSQVNWVPKYNVLPGKTSVAALQNDPIPDPQLTNLIVNNTEILPHTFSDATNSVPLLIPNLNSPTNDCIRETVLVQPHPSIPPTMPMSNKFSSLQGTEELVLSGSENDCSSYSEPISNSSGKKSKITQPKNAKGKGSKKPSSAKRK